VKVLSTRNWLAIVILIALFLGLIITAFVYDRPVRDAIVASQAGRSWNESAEKHFWSQVSRNGDWPQLMIVGGLALFLAIWIKRRDWVQVIAAALIASTLSGALINVSRLTTGRVRPNNEAEHGVGFHGPWHEGRLTIGNHGLNAFPSGHTATAVGFAAPFLFAKPILGVFVLLCALAIAWSRMQLGAHHLSDVVAATLISLAVGWAVLYWVRRHGEVARERFLALLLSVWQRMRGQPRST